MYVLVQVILQDNSRPFQEPTSTLEKDMSGVLWGVIKLVIASILIIGGFNDIHDIYVGGNY